MTPHFEAVEQKQTDPENVIGRMTQHNRNGILDAPYNHVQAQAFANKLGITVIEVADELGLPCDAPGLDNAYSPEA